VDRGDVEAVQRECGAAAKVEAQRLAPFRARHLQEARTKAADMRHNADVISGRPITIEEKQRAADTRRLVRTEGPAAIEDMLDEQPVPASEISDPQSEEIPW
jgi:hypothetical protein